MDGDGLIVFPDEYGYGGGECGYENVSFLCWTILDNRCGVAKGIVHGIDGRAIVVIRLFKMEGGGCHVTSNRFSGNIIIRLGYLCCHFFFGFTISFPQVIYHWFLVVIIPVLSCLLRFYNHSIKVISQPFILSIPIKRSLPVHINVEKLWLLHR